MDDVEILKQIREREEAVRREIEEFRKQQEAALEEKRKESAIRISEAEARARAEYEERLNRTREDVERRKREIMDSAMLQASRLKLEMSSAELKKTVMEKLLEYLKE